MIEAKDDAKIEVVIKAKDHAKIEAKTRCEKLKEMAEK